jgi:UDP-N-acetylglucosamine 4,6-dehydratase/5-epimerase
MTWQRAQSTTGDTGPKAMLDDKSILISGGTGSFGHRFVQMAVSRYSPRRLIIFSRDELKQYELQQCFPEARYSCMRYFIGDVRDRTRLSRAFDGVDYVIHAAALKQVPACEYNPIEAVRTNVMGAAHIIDAAIDKGVKKVIALSTDKAANPVNLYGATKLCSDKLFAAGNHYSGSHPTRFSVVRYGNVMGSRGSVIPYFLKIRDKGEIPITDPRMTRFWITLTQGVQFVMDCLGRMVGGEIMVPKIPSMSITDLAEAVAPGVPTRVVGIRPGEKLHEIMVPEEDARHTLDMGDHYVICPNLSGDGVGQFQRRLGGRACPEGFSYASNNNSRWLSVAELRDLIASGEATDCGGEPAPL